MSRLTYETLFFGNVNPETAGELLSNVQFVNLNSSGYASSSAPTESYTTFELRFQAIRPAQCGELETRWVNIRRVRPLTRTLSVSSS